MAVRQYRGHGCRWRRECPLCQGDQSDPEHAAEIFEAKKKEYEELFSNPYQAAQKGYIDDIIEPRNTRFRIIRALEQLAGKKQELPAKKHDNLPL